MRGVAAVLLTLTALTQVTAPAVLRTRQPTRCRDSGSTRASASS